MAQRFRSLFVDDKSVTVEFRDTDGVLHSSHTLSFASHKQAVRQCEILREISDNVFIQGWQSSTAWGSPSPTVHVDPRTLAE